MKLKLIKELLPGPKGGRKGLFKCGCGKTRKFYFSAAKVQNTCGCPSEKWLRSITKHGHSPCAKKSKTYNTWDGMKQRCLNKNNSAYKYYGARGITICKKWLGFKGFLEDMGVRPTRKTLDRINNDGNYTKTNCRWITMKEQAYNKRKWGTA